MERKEREKQEAKRRILDVARELFAEKGYEAVTLRTIAERVEYSPRTLYLHFKDKEDLFRQLCHLDFAAFGSQMGILAKVADPIERLRAIGLAYAQFGLENPNHYRLMFMTQVVGHPEDDPEACHKDNPEEDAYALLRACVQEAVQRDLLRADYRDADALAQVFWAALHGVLALEITHRSNAWVPWVPLQERVETTLDLLIRGVRKS